MYALIKYYRKISRDEILFYQQVLGYYQDFDEMKTSAWSSIEVKLHELENIEIAQKNFQNLPLGFLAIRYDCKPDQLPSQGRHLIKYSLFKHYLTEELYHTFKDCVDESQHHFFYNMICALVDGANNYQCLVLVPKVQDNEAYFVLYNMKQRMLDLDNKIRFKALRSHEIFKQISKKCYQINKVIYNISPLAYNQVLVTLYPYNN